MSYSSPGPNDGFWIRPPKKPPISAPAPKRPRQEPVSPQKPQLTESTSANDPTLDRLIKTNETRLAAIQKGDRRLARAALDGVVADLDALLDSAAAHLRQSGKVGPKHAAKTLKKNLALSVVAALPMSEIADLLDLPREQVADALIESLKSSFDAAEVRDAALARIDYLREQLQVANANKDHSLLDKLITAIAKVVQAIAIGVAATAASTFAKGEDTTSGLVTGAVVTALVTLALQSAVTATIERRKARDPYRTAQDALADLSSELMNAASKPGLPAYAFEATADRIRLLVKTCKAQQALLDVRWKHKVECWNALSALASYLGQSSELSTDRLRQSFDKLRAVGIPTAG